MEKLSKANLKKISILITLRVHLKKSFNRKPVPFVKDLIEQIYLCFLLLNKPFAQKINHEILYPPFQARLILKRKTKSCLWSEHKS